MKHPRWGRIETALLACIVVIIFLCLPPGMFSLPQVNEPVGDIYNSHTKLHAGILLKIDPAHDFPNGSTEEGWLIRGEHGPDVWFPASKLRRAIVEKR